MIVLLSASIVMYLYVNICLPFIENRKDLTRLNDVVLNKLPIIDMSLPISLLIHTTWICSVIEMYYYNGFYSVEKLWLKYTLVISVKAVTLYITPIDVPEFYIPLTDNLLSYYVKDRWVYGRDLFFSGHTSLACLCLLHATNTYTLAYYLFSLVSIMIMLMLNRVHYTVDIFIAPFICYCCHDFINLHF
jgi:hypothetical protein